MNYNYVSILFATIGLILYILTLYKISVFNNGVKHKEDDITRLISERYNLEMEKFFETRLDELCKIAVERSSSIINKHSETRLKDLSVDLDSIRNDFLKTIDSDIKEGICSISSEIRKPVQKQGSRCLNKINAEEDRINSKFIELDGKIKRRLPIVNERLDILDSKIDKIEKFIRELKQ